MHQRLGSREGDRFDGIAERFSQCVDQKGCRWVFNRIPTS
jgi:hypothetical protein